MRSWAIWVQDYWVGSQRRSGNMWRCCSVSPQTCVQMQIRWQRSDLTLCWFYSLFLLHFKQRELPYMMLTLWFKTMRVKFWVFSGCVCTDSLLRWCWSDDPSVLWLAFPTGQLTEVSVLQRSPQSSAQVSQGKNKYMQYLRKIGSGEHFFLHLTSETRNIMIGLWKVDFYYIYLYIYI